MGERAPRVTIGVPVYNGERYLAEALESLVTQTFPDVEIVVCDNASEDGTADIVRRYAERDRRIRHVRHPRNIGLGPNFSSCVREARAPFFKWQAADDRSEPGLVEACLDALERHPDAIVAFGDTRLIDAGGNTLAEPEDRMELPWPEPSRRFRAIFDRLALCNVQYGVMRTDMLRRTRLMGGYPGADIVLLAEMSLHGTFLKVPGILYVRRFHAQASSSIRETRVLEAFYDPRRSVRHSFRNWRHLREHTRSVWRAPIALREKLRLAGTLLKLSFWSRSGLWTDVRDAVGGRHPAKSE